MVLGRRLGRDRRRLLDVELAAFAPPGPDRAFEVRGVDHNAQEPVFANGIVRGPHLERHLVVGSEIDRLDVAAGAEVPEVDPMAILVREQILRHDPVLVLRRQPPLARHHVVARQVPPEVIVEVLGSAVDLPAAQDIERLAVHDKDARRPVGAILAAAERADVDAFGAAMDRVRPRVAGLFQDLLGLDDLVNFRLGGIGLRIHDIKARGPDSGDDQVAPLEERVAGERRQCRRAGVPAEMVELVTLVRHRHRVDDLTEGRRAGFHVDHCERVGLRKVRAQQQSISEVLRRSFHSKLRRCVEGRIRPHHHLNASLLCKPSLIPSPFAEHRPIVVRRKFDSSVRRETGGFNDHRDIAGFHPHLCPRSARLPEDQRFLTRTTMPIDDPELPFRFEDCNDGSRQAQLIRDAVQVFARKT